MTGNKNASSEGWYFYFDFLECAVLSDVPDAPETRTDVGLATDYDTDNTYKLSPQRLIWNLQKLGLVGEIDHYCGVFWWNQRKASGGNYPSATITFDGSWATQEVVWINIGGTYSNGQITGGTAIGKTVFAADTPETIAQHMAFFINATLVGVWAEANGATLTITCRSTGINWHVLALRVDTGTAHGTATIGGTLQHRRGAPTWVIDPTASQPLNRAIRDWHADYFAALKAAGIGVVVSFSQELVNPPDDPAGGAVWTQRYPDDSPATTDTGFGGLYSSMSAFSTPVVNYLASVYAEMGALMAAAGLTPRLQFGEVLWWYIIGASGMGFYDADTKAAAQATLGRALHTFLTSNDDPSVNGYADANFLAARLAGYVAAVQAAVLAQVPSALFEILWPLDVNDPTNCRLLHYVNLPPAWTDARWLRVRHVPLRRIPVRRDRLQSRRGADLRGIPVHGPLLGPRPLPVLDGLVLPRLAVGARVSGRAADGGPADQVLGLRPHLPVRMAVAPAEATTRSGDSLNRHQTRCIWTTATRGSRKSRALPLRSKRRPGARRSC